MDSEDLLLQSVLNLLDDGPRYLEDIVQALRESGEISDDEESEYELVDIIEHTDAIWDTASGVYGRTDRILDGVYLTHRLSQREIDAGLIEILPDFDGLDLGLEEIKLTSGDKLEEVYPSAGIGNFTETMGDFSQQGCFSGPSGWLSNFSSGDLIALHRIGDVFEVVTPDQLADGELERNTLSDVYGALYDSVGELGVEPMEVLLDALCEQSDIFRSPVAPLQELLREVGLELNGNIVEMVGEEYEAVMQEWSAAALANLFEKYGFGSCCAKEFEVVSDAFSLWKSGRKAEIDAFQVVKSLSHEAVAPAFVSWVFQIDVNLPIVIDEFMTFLASVKHPSVASVYFVRSVVRALQGKALLGEKDIQTALQYDRDYEPAKMEYAFFAADRGDIVTYISRLGQCMSEFARNELSIVREFLPNYPPTERNSPCPCGSGRKYKACCLVRPKMSPAASQNWLYHRVIRWMARPESSLQFTRYFEIFSDMLGDAEDDDSAGLFVIDVVVFEGEGYHNYLEMKGELLSESDRELLDALSQSKRALFEVVNVVPGKSLVLRDFKSNESVSIDEHLGSLDTDVGDYRLGRVVRTNEGPKWFGPGMKIDLSRRDSVLDLLESDYDVSEYLRWIASVLKRPELHNFDGEKLVFCETRIKPNKEINIASLLTGPFDQTDKNEWSQFAVSLNGGDISSGSIRDEGDHLVLSTNSVERMDRLLKKLEDLIGEYQVLERTAQSAESALKSREILTNEEAEGEELPPEAYEALQDYIEERENLWLDESIPALRGLTPRQALEDPKAKDDLIRLLDEFERTENRMKSGSGKASGGFKASRLRAKLGL